MAKWLLSTAILTVIFIIIIGIMQIFSTISLSSSIKMIENFDLSPITLQFNNIDNHSLYQQYALSDNELQFNNIHTNNDNIENCEYLIYQCAVGTDWGIWDMFKWSHPWIITVRDYAKKHNYCYKFDIFDKKHALRFLNENGYHWSQARTVLVKTFGIYCLEYAILKYSPKWLLYLDIDVSIPPQTMYNRTLQSILFDIQNLYNMDENTFYNEVTFIAQDLEWTVNSGIVFLNNNHNNYHKSMLQKQSLMNDYDVVSHWNDKKYSDYSQLLMSPKLEQLFDRIKSSLHHREYSLFYGYDQVILQDVILFYANLGFLKRNNSMESLVNDLLNKTITDDQYRFYDKKCLQFKVVRQHNNCYWGSLNKWGYPFGKRQFGPILLVSEDKYRMNMHNNYQDGDIFLHSRGGDARNQASEWVFQYNISTNQIQKKLP